MVHKTLIDVRFSDLDGFGHVNNAVYLTYVEQARIKFIADTMGELIDWKENGFILAKTEANYMLPILFGDEIKVETVCSKVGNKSMTLSWKIWKRTRDGAVEMCNGLNILVGFDYTTQKSMAMPETWKKALTKA